MLLRLEVPRLIDYYQHPHGGAQLQHDLRVRLYDLDEGALTSTSMCHHTSKTAFEPAHFKRCVKPPKANICKIDILLTQKVLRLNCY